MQFEKDETNLPKRRKSLDKDMGQKITKEVKRLFIPSRQEEAKG